MSPYQLLRLYCESLLAGQPSLLHTRFANTQNIQELVEGQSSGTDSWRCRLVVNRAEPYPSKHRNGRAVPGWTSCPSAEIFNTA